MEGLLKKMVSSSVSTMSPTLTWMRPEKDHILLLQARSGCTDLWQSAEHPLGWFKQADKCFHV